MFSLSYVMQMMITAVCCCHKPFVTQIDLIVDSESGRASSTDILNSADSLTSKKLKKSETENLLSRLVQDKWLDVVNRPPSLLLVFLSVFACPGHSVDTPAVLSHTHRLSLNSGSAFFKGPGPQGTLRNPPTE